MKIDSQRLQISATTVNVILLHQLPPQKFYLTSTAQSTQITNSRYKRPEKSPPSDLITAYLSANLPPPIKGVGARRLVK